MSAGSRYPSRSMEEMDSDAEREVHESIAQGVIYQAGAQNKTTFLSHEGRLLGHLGTFTYTPAYSEHLFKAIGELYKLPLPINVREVVIISSAANFGAKYSAYVHAPMARQTSSLSEAQIKALLRGEKPEDLKADESAAYDITRELQVTRGPLSDELFERGVEALGKTQTLYVIHFAGLYSLMSVVSNGASVGLPYGEDEVI